MGADVVSREAESETLDMDEPDVPTSSVVGKPPEPVSPAIFGLVPDERAEWEWRFVHTREDAVCRPCRNRLRPSMYRAFCVTPDRGHAKEMWTVRIGACGTCEAVYWPVPPAWP